MADREVDFLLVGGGMASAHCAAELRQRGAEGSVLLVGRDEETVVAIGLGAQAGRRLEHRHVVVAGVADRQRGLEDDETARVQTRGQSTTAASIARRFGCDASSRMTGTIRTSTSALRGRRRRLRASPR